jgi:predicted ATPase/DNA-binding SARP family transcriptional activator
MKEERMGELRLSLLGQVAIDKDGIPVTGFKSGKALALLCYLAATHRAHFRSILAGLLWGDLSEENARMNLRKAVENLRHLVGPHLAVTRQTVAFDRSHPYWLDVEQFETWVRDDVAAVEVGRLKEALELYQGDFLEGLDVREAVAFDEWLRLQRAYLREIAIQALQRLIDYHAGRREYQLSMTYTRRLLALDPWREEAHQHLMLLLARCGQRSAALAQYETCRRMLAQELSIQPTSETAALYKRIQAMETTRPPAFRLPSEPTALVGREQELIELARLLADPACRLLTLVGPGGIGKTRLALQAGLDQAESGAFLEGVYFVPSASVSSINSLIQAIAAALQLSFYGAWDPKDQLLNYLEEKELLLVLDNLEHLVSPPYKVVDLLTQMLAHAPAIKVLVTSRERLSLRQEWIFEVEGLDYPEPRSDARLVAAHGWEQFESCGAVQLFLQVARRLQPNVNLGGADRLALTRVCQLLAGMPLGIELAAAWVQILSCSEIAEEIERNLEFPVALWPDIPERHHSLHAVFEHAWSLLSADERDIFCRLSVFRGGFKLEAAEQVANASPVVLASLVSKSFLHQIALDQYEMHEFLRQRAEVKLREHVQEKELADARHARYYATFLQQREISSGGNPKQIVTEISAEIENIRTAWEWAVAGAKVKEIGQALEGLWGFYDTRGWFKEGEESFGQAADRLAREVRSSGTKKRGKTREAENTRRKLVLGQLLIRQGWFYYRRGNYRHSMEVLQVGLTALRQVEGDVQREVVFALGQLGLVAWYLGDYVEAKSYLATGLSAGSQEAGWLGLLVDFARGQVSQAVGEYEAAKQLYQTTITAGRAMNEPRTVAFQQICLSTILIVEGKYAEAERLLEESLALCQGIQDPFGKALALTYLGAAAHGQGQQRLAQQRHQASVEIFEEIGERWGIALALTGIGQATCALSEYEAARQYLRQALRMALTIEAKPLALAALVELAALVRATSPNENRSKRAIGWLKLALDHPASSQATKDQAARLLAQAEDD